MFRIIDLVCGLVGVGVLGVTMNVIAFFSLPVLDFIGIGEPLQKLTGRM